MDDVPLGSFFLIVTLLLLSGFFSLSEGALFSLGRHHREKLKKEGKKSTALIEELLKDPYKLIITILFADEVINVAYASVVASTVRHIIHGPPDEIITVICIAISSPSLLLLGEVGPKTLGVKYPRLLAGIISPPLHLFHLLITPIRWIILILSIGFTRLLGGKADIQHKGGFNTDEVKALVGLGSEGGVVTEVEKKLVGSLFKLEDVPAYKIMTPNIDCFSLHINIQAKDAILEVKKRGFSRVPVYKGEKNNIVGILYVKDLLSANPSDGVTVEAFLRQPYFIPRMKKAFDLLKEFQQKRIHLAVVVDEYGRIHGIVTMEDILEKLFGEIEDDRRIETVPKVSIGKDALIIPGSMKIDEFNDNFLFMVFRFGGLDSLGEEIEESIIPLEGEHATVAGFVLNLLGRFPVEGDSVVFGNLVFTVNKLSGKRIAELKVERAKKEEAHVA